jgi:hypothetical protein
MGILPKNSIFASLANFSPPPLEKISVHSYDKYLLKITEQFGQMNPLMFSIMPVILIPTL